MPEEQHVASFGDLRLTTLSHAVLYVKHEHEDPKLLKVLYEEPLLGSTTGILESSWHGISNR